LAGLQMVLESWINERATNENRGRLLSLYRIVDLSAATLGNMLLATANPAGFALLALTSILISLSLVPVALTTSTAPQPVRSAKLDVGRLWRVSPLSAAGALAIGAANGSFWSMGPVFVQRLGYDTGTVATFMSAVIVGGGIAQWPLGLLSDKIDRRRVILIVSACCAVAGAALAASAGGGRAALIAIAPAFGFFAMPLFGLCMAHGIDHAEHDDYVTVTAGLLLLYGIGSIVGPPIAPLLMQASGPATLFAFTSAIHVAFVLFGLYRLTRRAPVPLDEQAAYVPVPRTSPAVFELDPRKDQKAAEEDGAEDGASEQNSGAGEDEPDNRPSPQAE
ncbi:MAG: MFS transporter, partial [Pseudomonadota bacterium]